MTGLNSLSGLKNEEVTLNIEKQYQEDHSVKLVVEVDPQKMETYKKRAAAKISSRGNIPGFRPGKAPYHVVVRMYGEAAITEQAVDLFIDAEYSNILKEADVNPGASGRPAQVHLPCAARPRSGPRRLSLHPHGL
ncbi:MAG: hypothetical protein DPW18_10010 [Chloroflexi bacterium]|nr:hypothetical protein [Chloroflexota bacterium]